MLQWVQTTSHGFRWIHRLHRDGYILLFAFGTHARWHRMGSNETSRIWVLVEASNVRRTIEHKAAPTMAIYVPIYRTIDMTR